MYQGCHRKKTFFKLCVYLTILLFLEHEWALSQWPMRPKAEWAIDSEAIRARGIIVFSKIQLVGKKYRE